jgi:hypothetical protein
MALTRPLPQVPDVRVPAKLVGARIQTARSTRMPLHTSLEVPRKAGRIVKDYVFDLYLPAQGLPWPQRLRCAPMLLLVEYLVYRVDAIAEHARDVDLGRGAEQDAVRRYKATFAAYKARFESLLHRHHAHNAAVARQLELGEQYVYLENKVTSTRTVSHAEAMQLAELRPSDVRLLHAISCSTSCGRWRCSPTSATTSPTMRLTSPPGGTTPTTRSYGSTARPHPTGSAPRSFATKTSSGPSSRSSP